MYVLLKTYKHCLLNSINIIEQTLKLSGLTFDSKEIQLSITIKVQVTKNNSGNQILDQIRDMHTELSFITVVILGTCGLQISDLQSDSFSNRGLGLRFENEAIIKSLIHFLQCGKYEIMQTLLHKRNNNKL